MTGCRFRISVKKQRITNTFRIMETPIKRLTHNHPKVPLREFVAYRTELLNALKGAAIARFIAGETPSIALDGLRAEYPEASKLTMPDVGNLFMFLRREQLEGRPLVSDTPSQETRDTREELARSVV